MQNTFGEQLLGHSTGLMAEARELCERAEEMYPEDRDRAIAAAFQTVLAWPTRTGCVAPRRWSKRTKWRHDKRCKA